MNEWSERESTNQQQDCAKWYFNIYTCYEALPKSSQVNVFTNDCALVGDYVQHQSNVTRSDTALNNMYVYSEPVDNDVDVVFTNAGGVQHPCQAFLGKIFTNHSDQRHPHLLGPKYRSPKFRVCLAH